MYSTRGVMEAARMCDSSYVCVCGPRCLARARCARAAVARGRFMRESETSGTSVAFITHHSHRPHPHPIPSLAASLRADARHHLRELRLAHRAVELRDEERERLGERVAELVHLEEEGDGGGLARGRAGGAGVCGEEHA